MAKFPLGRLARGEFPGFDSITAMTRTGPTINRGKGNNAASTPMVFVDAVQGKFGPLQVDLAASDSNTKASCWVTEAANSLALSWFHEFGGSLCWLNPPFTNITPWAKKCAEEVQLGARILLLIPASVGANYYWDWIVPYADVYSVGRMVFDDCYDKHGELITTSYPKDLVLAHYDWSREAEKAGQRTGESYVDHQLGGRAELIRWRWQNG